MVPSSYMSGGADPLPEGALLASAKVIEDNGIIPYLAKDVVFVLDQIKALNRADPNGSLTGKLDLQRVACLASHWVASSWAKPAALIPDCGHVWRWTPRCPLL